MGAKNRCTGCKCYFIKETMISITIGKFCTQECIRGYGMKDPSAVLKKVRIIKEKKESFEHKQKKKALKPRKYWFDKLQTLVNQYVIQVRDKDKPCCTCGDTSPDNKFDAGHCFSRGARSDIRFNLFNIHRQCSVRCNQHGSGMQAEYKVFIVAKYGQEKLDELEMVQPDLKTQFPGWQDIELEILRYRVLLRDNGVTPNV